MLFGFSTDFLAPTISILEKIVRPLVVYLFLLFAFRIFGKRQFAQLTPFDLIVLLTISNVVQNAMIGNDSSLLGGIVGATTILVANFMVAYLTYHYPRIDRIIEGQPVILVQDGKIIEENLRRELLTQQDLFNALRRSEIDPETQLDTLKMVELDTDGQITVIRKTRLPRKLQSQ
ncbi:MAG TPA: YetF domain-containing protein [Anaerolineae bacterium]|nr:YetF domain-containing protein [Anaerolineae bacterium]